MSTYSTIKGPSLLEHLKIAGLIKERLFSMYLKSSTHGEIQFGSFDASKFVGRLRWLQTEGLQEWHLPVTGFSIGNAKFEVEDSEALIDTGTNAILCPEAFFKLVVEATGATRVLHQFWEVKCLAMRSLPQIAFWLGGHRFALSPRDYIKREGKHRCVLSLIPYNAGHGRHSLWILGDPFLRAYYTVFDAENKRIGLAPAFKVEQM